MAKHEIAITKRYPAPVGEVYRAWTDPAKMRQWLANRVDADLRVGGRYRFENDGDDGAVYVHTGEYLALEPDHRVLQTFRAGNADTDIGAESLYLDEYIEVVLTPVGPNETSLSFTNGWDGDAMSEADRAATADAWSGWLDQLVRALPT